MKKKLLLPAIALAVTALSFGFLRPTEAAVPPSIEGGDFYQVKNLTKGGNYGNAASASKCEELQYRIQIHNPGPDSPLNNVNVKVNLPGNASTQNVSTATVSASNANPASVSDTATVNLSESLKITYVPGSSQLLNAQGGSAGAIGDVTSGAGVNIGNVGISINEQRFVIFKAKVDCPQPPQPEKKFVCKALNTTKINRTTYKFTAVAQVQNVTIQNYVFTTKNQSGSTVDTKTVTTGATSADYEFSNNTPGTYTITAVINTDAGATNPDTCKQQITIEKEGEKPKPPVTPPSAPPSTPSAPATSAAAAPSALPDTGPGDIAGIFALVTTISSVAYYLVTKRSISHL